MLIWFTHKSLDAWETVISALYAAGFRVTRIWPVSSELLTRLVSKRNNSTLNMTLVIVARKRIEESDEACLKELAVEMMNEMYDTLIELDATEIELKTFLQAAAMCAATKIKPPRTEPNLIQYIQLKLIPKTKKIASEFISKLYKLTVNKKNENINLEDFL